MSLIRWYPGTDMEEMRRELTKLFNVASHLSEPTAKASNSAWTPAVDIWEDADAYYISAELPGLALEEVSVQVEGGQLLLKGSRRPGFEDGHSVHRVERSYGEFERLFPLPANLDLGRVSARMKDGILTIHLPKAESARPRQITIIGE